LQYLSVVANITFKKLFLNCAQPQTAPVDLNVNWQLSHHDITDTLNGGTVGGQTTYEQLFLGITSRANVSAALDNIDIHR
jgi:hypothetical protein